MNVLGSGVGREVDRRYGEKIRKVRGNRRYENQRRLM